MRKICALTLLVAFLPSIAFAKEKEPYQPSPPTIVASPIAMAIAAWDRDGDLKVTGPEFDWGVSRSFAAFDRENDGSLSLIEFGAWAEATLGNSGALPGYLEFDKDGNDRISKEEFRAYFAGRFKELDKDGNGSLSRSELVTFAPMPARGRDGKGGRR
jgi:hypothetical protein